VVLPAHRDEDILDYVVELQRLHGVQLGADQFGAAGTRRIHVDAVAGPAEDKAAGGIHQGRGDRAVHGHDVFEGFFNGRHVAARYSRRICGLASTSDGTPRRVVPA
jgi:hypothetical protein